jgi:hypothetical protein
LAGGKSELSHAEDAEASRLAEAAAEKEKIRCFRKKTLDRRRPFGKLKTYGDAIDISSLPYAPNGSPNASEQGLGSPMRPACVTMTSPAPSSFPQAPVFGTDDFVCLV